jgi:hypothetical protein
MNNCAEVPLKEQMESDIEHYDEISSIAHCWRSSILRAIRFYYEYKMEKEKEQEIEAIKYEYNCDFGYSVDIEYKVVDSEPYTQDTYIPYQICPKCNGQGIVSKPPWVPGDVNQWISSSCSFVCDVCNGAKMIPMIKL